MRQPANEWPNRPFPASEIWQHLRGWRAEEREKINIHERVGIKALAAGYANYHYANELES